MPACRGCASPAKASDTYATVGGPYCRACCAAIETAGLHITEEQAAAFGVVTDAVLALLTGSPDAAADALRRLQGGAS